MNLQTFKAPSMAEALTQVKGAMGHDAVILHTRTFYSRQWLGLRRREMVEITAGRGLNVGERAARRQAVAARTPLGYRQPTLLPSPKPVPADPSPHPASNYGQPRSVLETPAATNVAMLTMSQEVSALKGMVADLVKETKARAAPNVPEDLIGYYTQLVTNQVAEEIAADVVRNVQRQLRPEHLQVPDFVREKIAEQLEKYIAVAGPIKRTKTNGPHVVALVGPTGVGKTTTLAKLAASLKLHEKRRVGLITLDTYRIAAVDQLKRYADIIGSPLKVVSSQDELREAIRAMSDMDFILIDTAGRSPRDELKLGELKALLAAAGPDEVHLVMSATASQDSVDLAVTKFSEVRVDRIIFTKLDEAAHVGVVLNVVSRVNKRLSYVTTGQDVPNDIEVGRGRQLAHMLLSTGA